MPYLCTDCRSYFSVRTGTAIEKSRLLLQKWVSAIFLNVTRLKSVSSLKLHRDLKVTQNTAWFMQHGLREAWAGCTEAPFSGPVEIDETYIGGKRNSKSNAERKALRQAGAGRGGLDKEAVAGAKDRLTNVLADLHIEKVDQPTPGVSSRKTRCPARRSTPTSTEAPWGSRSTTRRSSTRLASMFAARHISTRRHGIVLGDVQARLPRHLPPRFAKAPAMLVSEFARKNNIRDRSAIEQVDDVVAGMVGRRLMYRELMSD